MVFEHYVARRIKEFYFHVIALPLQIDESKVEVEFQPLTLIQPLELDVING